MKSNIIIVGAGGHAKNVVDAIQKQDVFNILGFYVDGIDIGTNHYKGIKVLDTLKSTQKSAQKETFFIVALGDNNLRTELFDFYRQIYSPATIVHPNATISLDSEIAPGCVILSNSVVNANVKIGENCLINAGVIIDHDCSVGKNVHLKIGSLVQSNSIISDNFQGTLGQHIF
jgi:sugar O-acyltransferase (sialic acid O-acetyltransferase NeuD family)